MTKVQKVHSLTGRITPTLVYDAWRAVRRNRGAAGIDKVSIQMFQANLDQNLDRLLRELKTGAFQPLPARRVYIPKGRGGMVRRRRGIGRRRCGIGRRRRGLTVGSVAARNAALGAASDLWAGGIDVEAAAGDSTAGSDHAVAGSGNSRAGSGHFAE